MGQCEYVHYEPVFDKIINQITTQIIPLSERSYQRANEKWRYTYSLIEIGNRIKKEETTIKVNENRYIRRLQKTYKS